MAVINLPIDNHRLLRQFYDKYMTDPEYPYYSDAHFAKFIDAQMIPYKGKIFFNEKKHMCLEFKTDADMLYFNLTWDYEDY